MAAPILIPLLSLTPRSLSGVTFARGVIPPLVALLGAEGVVVLCDVPGRELLADVPCRFEVTPTGDSRAARLLATRFALPRAVRRHRPGALYVPDGQLIGAPVPTPAVVALHFHLNFSRPEGTSLSRRLYWRFGYDRAFRRDAARAGALLAPTAAFARELVAFVPEAEGRLHVVPHGVAPCFRPARAPAKGPPRVVAIVNAFEYKNLAGAARIFGRAAADLPHELHVAGLPAEDVWSVVDAVDLPAAVRARIRVAGRLPPARLAELYRGAAALLFPSFVESFGLPVAEAMASGLPVACSRLPALEEVGGDALALADPADEPAFAALLRALLTEPERAARQRRLGLERARSLTWQRSAEATAAILRSVARPPP